MGIQYHYTATSLEDIAEEFDLRATAAEDQAFNTTKTSRARLEAEADTWKVAAQILRNTTLKQEGAGK